MIFASKLKRVLPFRIVDFHGQRFGIKYPCPTEVKVATIGGCSFQESIGIFPHILGTTN